LINLIINNRSVQVKPGTTVLQACEVAQAEVPRFCYHDRLSVAGNCRMCLVEIEKSPKPVVSCAMPVMEGMRVYTDTPLAKKASETVLEFLLVNHPLDCPICDQGGECDLQDQTLAYGSDRGRFFEYKRGVEDKECGPIIKTIMTRCIHCTRCVRFTEEISGTNELGTINRGKNTEIGPYVNKFIKTELSGNLVDLCPVGALTSKPYAFIARSWELKSVESIDFLDAVCSNITINTRNLSQSESNTELMKSDEILRILPRLNEDINEEWISDKTRYAFDGLKKQRLTQPSFFIKNKQVSSNWSDILNYINFYTSSNLVKNLKYNKIRQIGGLFGSLSDMESIYYLFQFLNELGSNSIQYSNNLFKINVDIPLFYEFNTKIKQIEESDLILLIGVNPRLEASMVNVRIRKQYMRHNITVGLVGSPVDLTYPYLHLGTTTKTLIQIGEGKHPFCKQLRQAKRPLIIYGTEFLQRRDSGALVNIIRFIAKNIFAHSSQENNLNLLHSSVGLMNQCSLGINPGIRSKLYLNNNKSNFDTLFLLNINDLNNNKWINFKNKLERTTVFLQDSHITNAYKYADFILPTSTAYEKSAYFTNTEGLVQKTYQATTNFENTRNSVNVLKAAAQTLNLCEPKKTHNFTSYAFFNENPYASQLNKYNKSFNMNYLNYKESQNKIYLSGFLPLVKNFYLTDSISNNSITMAECSLFLSTRINFLKKMNNKLS
jgi:NADH dehydrogenase (ubiquinone) Fe-S protein 1